MFGRRPSPAEKLAALRASYGSALPGKLAELQAAAQPLFDASPAEETRDVLDSVRGHAHKLAGGAATFGYGVVSDTARELENVVTSLIEQEEPPDSASRTTIRKLVTDLAEAARHECNPSEGSGTSGSQDPTPAPDGGLVIVVASEDEIGNALADRVEASGFAVHRLSVDAEVPQLLTGPEPRAIVVHSALAGALTAGRSAANECRRRSRADVPLICVAETDEFESRMRAVRAGARAYVTEPVDASSLKRAIEDLSSAAPFAPYRILIVEDDEQLAAQCAGAFDGPGYAVRILSDPRELPDRLATRDTELIVMDMSVAGASGLDLARLVWQYEEFQKIPIIFLSPGPEFNRQILSVGVSDDLFVPRPVDSHALCTRALRHLRSSRDGRYPRSHRDVVRELDRIASLLTHDGDNRSGVGVQHARPSDGRAAIAVAPRVLVVDDDRHIVDAIAITLAAHGIEVLRAFNGEQGYKVALGEHPDLIISDYAMPNGSGDQMLRRLKATADTKDIPVVILTGHTLDGRKDYALEREMLGRLAAVSYLAKPIDFAALVAEVGRILNLDDSASA